MIAATTPRESEEVVNLVEDSTDEQNSEDDEVEENEEPVGDQIAGRVLARDEG